MKGSIEHTRVAINTMRARLTILGFNLAIITFQLSNTHGLGGGTRIEGFETTVHFSTGVVLLAGLALSISSMVVFISSSSFDREGTCDSRMLLAGDFLMYLALSQTVSGFFSSYGRVLDIVSISAQTGDAALYVLRTGILLVGAMAWILVTYVGPIVSLFRSDQARVSKLIHVAGYLFLMTCISQLWWAAHQFEGRTNAHSQWFNAFIAPLNW